MNRSIRIALAALAASTLVALAAAGGAAAAQEYEPFVTDFPKAEAPAEPYRPFATDFGIAPRAPGEGFTIAAKGQPAEPTTGRAWSDVALGGGFGIAFAVLVAAAALGVRGARLRRGGRHGWSLEPQAAPPQ